MELNLDDHAVGLIHRTKTIRLYNYGQSYSSIYDYSIIRFMIMYFDYFDVWSGA